MFLESSETTLATRAIWANVPFVLTLPRGIQDRVASQAQKEAQMAGKAIGELSLKAITAIYSPGPAGGAEPEDSKAGPVAEPRSAGLGLDVASR
jgi:hypothetical protein